MPEADVDDIKSCVSNLSLNRETIQAEYERLGYTKGWNFLACREERLRDAQIAIVGLNPGGGGDKDDGYSWRGVWSCQNNSFCVDDSEMRGQVCEWHRVIGVDPEATLCAQFIPFRSPDIRRLGNRPAAVAFARAWWTEVLETTPASLFLVMGKYAAWHIADLLKAKPVPINLQTGWGRATIDISDSSDGRRVVAMPHPSRFKLFGRDEVSITAEQSLQAAVGARTRRPASDGAACNLDPKTGTC